MKVLAPDVTMEDDVVGFHAQQAVEKALKAAVVAVGEEHRSGHDLDVIVRRLEAAGLEVPPAVVGCGWLTLWAVEHRYGEGTTGLDRERALATAEAALEWSMSVLR